MRLQGKTALVTGSSSGIGRAIATRFALEGADIVINGRDEKKIAGVVKEIEGTGRRALGIRANVGSFTESKAMVERAISEFGHLDILVCNAGVFHHTPFLQLGEGVTANAIAPGLVDTPILANFTEEGLANFRRGIPVRRIGKPEEIAEAALYFASDEAGYVTGQVLNMSGGSYI
jgi:NAD(P)-dependent dehydrogenase (short-subunit alcohol dehydrogenase family)